MARWCSSGFDNLLVPWTTVQPSRRARRWRQGGLGIAIASALALFGAAVASSPFNLGLAILAGVVVVVGWAAARERSAGSFEIGVSAAGTVELRACALTGSAAVSAQPLRVSFAAPWLISLRRGTMLIPIWPDCLPPSIFRQLWVHLRWGRAAPSDDEQQSTRTPNGTPIQR